ncbi:MAG: DUF3592 domain-containing protein [Burkholderiales bacterium]
MAFAVLMFRGAVLFAISSWETYSSRDWPRVPGTIVASYTEHTCGAYRQLHSWEGNILYRYSVSGRRYEGSRVSVFKTLCDSDKEVVQRWLHQNYPVGTAVDVFYNSTDPAAAFLHPGVVSKFELFMIAALIRIGSILLWGSRMSFRVAGTRYTAPIGFRFFYRSKCPESSVESTQNIEGKQEIQK